MSPTSGYVSANEFVSLQFGFTGQLVSFTYRTQPGQSWSVLTIYLTNDAHNCYEFADGKMQPNGVSNIRRVVIGFRD
jgi:hypothetical protein